MKPLINLHKAAGSRPFASYPFYNLINSFFVFSMAKNDFIFNHHEKILESYRKIFRDPIFFRTLKATLGKQFTCGETISEAKGVIQKLSRTGIKIAINYMAEFDRNEKREEIFDENMKKYLESVEIYDVSGRPFFVAVKVSGLVDFELLERAGHKQHEIDLIFAECNRGNAGNFQRPIAELEKRMAEKFPKLSRNDIQDFLNKIAVFSKGGNLHLFEWRLGASFYNLIDESMHESPVLKEMFPWTAEERMKFDALIRRMKTITDKVEKYEAGLLVDAEQSYFFSAITVIVEQLQYIYNYQKGKVTVFNTVQAYLQNSHHYIEYEISKRSLIGDKYQFALKLVRGAYILEEHQLEKKLKINIVQDSKQETDKNYDDCAELITRNLHHNSCFIVASHNQYSVEKLITMAQDDPSLKSKLIFATLYGLNDFMGIGANNLGYQAMKYLPYGERQITLPYLMRRGVEARKMIADDPNLLKDLAREIWLRLTFRGKSFK